MLVELDNESLIGLLLSVPVSAKESSSSLHEYSLPSTHLAGVDLEPAGNLRRSLFTFQGFQGYLGFECWAILLTTLLHLLLLLTTSA
jgi:hypothetical protein